MNGTPSSIISGGRIIVSKQVGGVRKGTRTLLHTRATLFHSQEDFWCGLRLGVAGRHIGDQGALFNGGIIVSIDIFFGRLNGWRGNEGQIETARRTLFSALHRWKVCLMASIFVMTDSIGSGKKCLWVREEEKSS